MQGTGNAAYDMRVIEEELVGAVRTVAEDYLSTLTVYERQAANRLREAAREYRLRDASDLTPGTVAEWTATEYAEKIDADAARPAQALLTDSPAVDQLAEAVQAADAWAQRPLLNESRYTRERQTALATEAAQGETLLTYLDDRVAAIHDAATTGTVRAYITGEDDGIGFVSARDPDLERTALDRLVSAQWTEARLRQETGTDDASRIASSEDTLERVLP